MPLVHRQISPRSRISLFHFIYDKVGATSPIGRCARVVREGGCPPRFGFRRVREREREREWSFCRNKTRLSNQARAGIDGPATIIAVMERAHLSAGRSGAQRQRFSPPPLSLWLFRGFHRGSSIFQSSFYRAPRSASISLIALKCTRNPRFFNCVCRPAAHRVAACAHVTRAANFASLSTTNNEPGIIRLSFCREVALQISRGMGWGEACLGTLAAFARLIYDTVPCRVHNDVYVSNFTFLPRCSFRSNNSRFLYTCTFYFLFNYLYLNGS